MRDPEHITPLRSLCARALQAPLAIELIEAGGEPLVSESVDIEAAAQFEHLKDALGGWIEFAREQPWYENWDREDEAREAAKR